MKFRILGPLEVESDEELLPVGRRQPRAVLTVLLLDASRVVSRDRLVEALWGEAPPERAANALQVYVSQLRGSLGRELIVTRPPGYMIHVDEGQLDLERFDLLASEACRQDAAGAASGLREALALWRGPPLADLPDTPLLEGERRRLEELRLGALEARIDADLALGEHATLVPELETLVREHPLRERLRGQLILALYQSERQAEALEVFGQGRRLLADELGLEPGQALKQLQKRILDQDPALAPLPARRRAPVGSGEEPPTDGGRVASRPRVSEPGRVVATRHRRRLAVLLAGGALLLAGGVAAAVVAVTGGAKTGLGGVSPSSVGEIDPRGNRIVAQIPIAGRPARIAGGGGRIWVASDGSGTLSALDPRARTTSTLVATGGFPTDVAAGEGFGWAVDGRSGVLVKIDPAYGVVRRIRVAAPNAAYDTSREGFDPVSVAAGSGSVWLTDGSRRLVRVDPASNTVVRHIDLGSPLDAVAVGDGAVWAISGAAASAIRLDRRGNMTVRIPIVSKPGFESPYPLAVAVGEGYVWVLNGNTATVTKIDPAERTVAATIPIGIEHAPVRLTTGGGAAWVANNDGTLSRIDANTDVVTTIPIGHRIEDVAFVEGHVWVTAGSGLSSAGAPTVNVKGTPVQALPTSSCSPIYFGGAAPPQYLIVSDLPLQGSGRTETAQLSQAVQFELKQHRFRAGRYAIGYQACDDSVATGPVSPAHCVANAHAYVKDKSVIGVIGPWATFCSQIEIPILNGARGGPLAMISPSNTYVGLTHPGPGTAPDEPAKYYPTGTRNYVRTMTADDVQGAADAILAHRLGAKSVYVLRDGEPYGDGIAAEFSHAASKLGLRAFGPHLWNYKASSYKHLVTQIRATGAGAVFLGTFLLPESVRLLKDLRAELAPATSILLPDGFAPPAALIQAAGVAAEGVTVSAGGIPNSQLPPSGKKFVTAFARAVGETPFQWPAAAAQATDVLLSAIARSDGTRASVTARLFKTRVSNGILGSFSFDRNGDTTAGAVTIYRIVNGNPVVFRVITPPTILAR
jgi:DNA-binding SARP family transcriptional activator/ABC-type branched-subunit amino acid transport system substrate-binding protein